MAQIVVESEEDEESEGSRGVQGAWRRRSHVTDEYWCFFFTFILGIWISSWFYAISHYNEPDSKISFENITATKNGTELTQYHFWGLHWLFDAITCNLAFINAHYESSGSIVIAANVLVTIGLIIYSISSMSSDYFNFHSRIDIALTYFLSITLILRLLTYTARYLTDESIINRLISPSHEKLTFWLMPEMIVIMICYTKKSYAIHYDFELLTFSKFKRVMIPFVLVSLMIFGALYICTMTITYKLGWDCALTYVIVGGSCYIGLTIFYYLSIVICATGYYSFSGLFEYEDGYRNEYKVLLQAFIWVARCHLGTACYHATLILPRVHALFVMNNPAVKSIPEYAKITDRLYVTHCKLHNLTLMSTAMYATNHPVSLRKLLCYYARKDDLKQNMDLYLQGFSKVTRPLVALFISTNNLLLMTLWFYGLDDPSFSLATWVLYLRSMIVLYASMKLCDMAYDPVMIIRHICSVFYAHTPITPESVV